MAKQAAPQAPCALPPSWRGLVAWPAEACGCLPSLNLRTGGSVWARGWSPPPHGFPVGFSPSFLLLRDPEASLTTSSAGLHSA